MFPLDSNVFFSPRACYTFFSAIVDDAVSFLLVPGSSVAVAREKPVRLLTHEGRQSNRGEKEKLTH